MFRGIYFARFAVVLTSPTGSINVACVILEKTKECIALYIKVHVYYNLIMDVVNEENSSESLYLQNNSQIQRAGTCWVIFTTAGHWRNDCQQMAPSVSQQQPRLLQQRELHSHLHILPDFHPVKSSTRTPTWYCILLGIIMASPILHTAFEFMERTFNVTQKQQ